MFGDTDFFRKGLNDLIGLPDTDVGCQAFFLFMYVQVVMFFSCTHTCIYRRGLSDHMQGPLFAFTSQDLPTVFK